MFLIAGAAPALMDTLIPDQIDPKTKAENMEVLNEMSQTFNDAYSNLVKTAEQSDRQLINGRLIYPRYYGQNEGQSGGHPWASYQIRDFSRLGFVLLNRENYDVIIPLSEEPASIPNGSDVLISGKFDPGGFFRADFILFTDVYDEDGEPRLILGDTAF